MSISDISNVFSLLGGLGMFLYGMNLMADGLQKTAGDKLRQFLGMLTNNRLLGVLLGTAITAIIQSSSATTVMVVGFVNAGILNLTQAVGVIMGANIGTTVTAWIVSMSQLGSVFEVTKPSFFSPLLIGFGAMIVLFAKKDRTKTAGEILIGFGLLFIGLDFMSGAMKPYTSSPLFSNIFATLGKNPFLGLLAGAVVTGIIQSSSASVGILQTLAISGAVTTNSAIFITLGQNIGTCVTALLSSTGSTRIAKRAAVIHLLFNVIGAVLFGIGFFVIFMLKPDFANSTINAVQISIFHTIFNLTNTLILFPFANQLVQLSGVIVRGKDEAVTVDEAEIALRHLDERIFESPAFAVETVSMEVVRMGQVTLKNVQLAVDALLTGNLDEIQGVYKTEQTINNMEKILTEYLIKVDNLSLSEKQKKIVTNLFYSISDIERVGDHAENLAEQAEYKHNHNLEFSETGISDLKEISGSVVKAFTYAIDARQFGNMDSVRKVSQYEDEVDNLEEEMREKHIERLSAGECEPSSGVVFLDVLSNLERISDHAYNLAGYVKDEI